MDNFEIILNSFINENLKNDKDLNYFGVYLLSENLYSEYNIYNKKKTIFNEAVENINNFSDKGNFIINTIRSTVSNKANSFMSTLSDLFVKVSGIPIAAKINKNELLSNKISSLFQNTTVNIYTFTSKQASIIALPGLNVSTDPTMIRVHGILRLLGHRNPFFRKALTSISLFSICEKIVTNVSQNRNDGGEMKLDFDKSTNKIITNIKEVTIYISSQYFISLDKDDELIASILYEISKNTRLSAHLNTSITIGAIITLIGIFSFKRHENIKNKFDSIGLTLLPILIICLALFVFSMIIKRRSQIIQDEFVIKCGYGDALNRAINKFYKFKINDDKSANLNFIDKIIHNIIGFCTIIKNTIQKLFKFMPQDIKSRTETIKSKNGQ